MADERFIAVRDRAYDLAETGHFKQWAHVAKALRNEGYRADLIDQLDRDKLAVMMITRCCVQAIERLR
ncbi:hypothetical protein [Terricaulis sp.]|uniref:hypothetical protein n=1 Tax=Terricaulis sp. TaxID=2768686 RepID=UPI003782D88D